MDWTAIVIAIIGTGVLSEWLNFLRNKKNLRRLSEAETALKKIEVLERIIDNVKSEIVRLKDIIDEERKKSALLSKERDYVERKNIDYKRSLNAALECKNSENCPALKKKSELDEKRAQEFEKSHKN